MAKIRDKLRDEEYLSQEIEDSGYEKIFLGDAFGVMLTRRGADDPHVVFTMIMEDDNHWFVPRSGSVSSSFFFKDAISVLRHAENWCKENCLDDTCGFQFK